MKVHWMRHKNSPIESLTLRGYLRKILAEISLDSGHAQRAYEI